MYGLNIHLKSFKLNPKLASGNDKIRVSITTLPEKKKEAFVTEARQMNFVHYFFTINVTDQTQKIIFVFRKIEFFDDPIIASTILHAEDLPTTNPTNVEMKMIKIFEPIQNEGNNKQKRRGIIGEMEIQMSLTTAFPTFEESKNNNKQSKKVHKYSNNSNSNNNDYSKVNYENQNRYKPIFIDDYC